jgi:antitoxin ParD1/3/4
MSHKEQQDALSKGAQLSTLDASIARGIADAEAKRVKSLAEVFDRLEAKYRALAEARHD